MKARAMRELTRNDLTHRKAELQEERFNLNMRLSLKALDNPLRLRLIDREIARVLTVLNEDSKGISSLADIKTSVLSSGKEPKND